MINSIATANISMLQVALGLKVQMKKLIEHLHDYGVTSSYDEVRRFKISAAHSETEAKKQALDSKNGLIPSISDNAHLCTRNGLKQTHSLATIIIQHSSSTDKVKREPIKRLKKHQLTTVPLDDVNMKIYSGEKKPQVPASFGKFGVLPLRVLCHQIIITRKSQNDDFEFIQESLKDSNTPDFSGYNTRRTRETGQTKKLKTRILYKPLINKTPSDPSTILTAMCDLESTSRQAGQCVSVFTCDQQLYRVALDIVWAVVSFLSTYWGHALADEFCGMRRKIHE